MNIEHIEQALEEIETLIENSIAAGAVDAMERLRQTRDLLSLQIPIEAPEQS